MKRSQFRLVICCFIFVVSLGNTSCKNEEDNLPPQTFEGKNTLGCKVNGNDWIPTTDDFLLPGIVSSHYLITNKNFLIGAQISTKNISQYLTIVVNNFSETPNEYVLKSPNSSINADSAYGVYRNYAPGPKQDFFTNNLNNGKLIISKIDSVERIVSGRFEFEALDTLSGETIKVTAGRFDLRYQRYQ